MARTSSRPAGPRNKAGRTLSTTWFPAARPRANEQIQAINDYLAKNFGQVNVNKGPSAEIASVLEITSDQADAIVKYRMDHGDFKSMDDLKKVPGLESAKLDTKKDRVVY